MSLVLNKIDEMAGTSPKKIAIISQDKEITYQQLKEDIYELAEKLSKISERRIAFNLPNCYEWLVLDLALIKANKISIPVPNFFSEQQRKNLFTRAGVEIFINDKNYGFQKLNYKNTDLPEDTDKITFTSGTTCDPKGVCLSQEGIEQTALSIIDVLGEDLSERNFAVLLLPVLLENIAGFYGTILCGKTYIITPLNDIGFAQAIPDFKLLFEKLKKSKASSCILVPEIIKGLIAHIYQTNDSLPDMKYIAVGGSKVSPNLLEQAEKLGLPVYQGYGLSECASVVSLNTPENNDIDSVGKILPHIDYEIINNQLIIKDPATLGYIGDNKKPAIHKTGDLVDIDENGFLKIIGRKKNVIINSYGRNISPEWIESEILSTPYIAQAVVFGDAKPALTALIVPSSIQVTNEQIQNHLNKINIALPDYARVKHWAKVLPFTVGDGLLTGTGRPKRENIEKKYKTIIEDTYKQEGKMTRFFERLIKETEEERNYLYSSPQVVDGLKGDISLETYIAYLQEAYHHVKHTVPLMMTCGSKLPTSKKEHIREALAEYIEEEIGHDEWILNDIQNCGGDKEKARNSQPNIATDMMVAYAYDYVSRVNPVGFFGMVFVLEGTSTQLATNAAEKIKKKLGLKNNCFTYLFSHGSLDIEHMKFFEELMGKINDPEDQEAIIHMAKRMFVLFANVFRSIPHKNLEVKYVS
jgi:long-subunit acyl-CoA synthetase (AMP-forming)/heme oxygenase